MEFKEMQIIWDNQNNEKLFAINEAALHEQIKQKGSSINSTLNKVEFLMVGVNIVVSIILVIDIFLDSAPLTDLIIPFAYFAYAIYMFYRRTSRKQEEVHFAPTIVGDLNKAIWQVEYLINQSKQMIYWYLIPLLILVSVFMAFNGKPFWALGLTAVVLPLSYFGRQWEINRCYMPKLRDLETLRATLLEWQTTS